MQTLWRQDFSEKGRIGCRILSVKVSKSTPSQSFEDQVSTVERDWGLHGSKGLQFRNQGHWGNFAWPISDKPSEIFVFEVKKSVNQPRFGPISFQFVKEILCLYRGLVGFLARSRTCSRYNRNHEKELPLFWGLP